MPIVNGKIVRSKTSKKVVKDEPKVKSKKKSSEKEKKNPIKKGYDDLEKDVKASKPKKSEKKAKKKSPKEDFIRTGAMAGLQIEQSEYNGDQVVAVRKMYCTKNDPEMKIGKGGFNLPLDADVLDGVIEALQQIRDSM